MITFDKSKLNLVLDLDNTLISTIQLSTHEDNEIVNKNTSRISFIDFPGTDFRIFIRPHLQAFLDYAFSNFNVAVWTAGNESYGNFIINNIITINQSQKDIVFLHKENCDQSAALFDKNSPKDLRYLYYFEKWNFHPCNTIIMDDLDLVEKANPLQTLRAVYFDVRLEDADKDFFLIVAINHLESVKDKFEKNPCIAHIDSSKHKIHSSSLKNKILPFVYKYINNSKTWN